MALPVSGKLSIGDVRAELGLGTTTRLSLSSSQIRSLANKPTGKISLSDLRGKSLNEDLLWQGTFYSTYGGKVQTGGSVVGQNYDTLFGQYDNGRATVVRLPNCVIERIETSHSFVGFARPGQTITYYTHSYAATATVPSNESWIYQRLPYSSVGAVTATVRAYGRKN